MMIDIQRQVCDGHLLKWLVAAGLAWLEQHQERVNQMNVFPVPDGDTGTNMRYTLQKAYDEIAMLDEPHAGIVAGAVAKGALLGARGNSGVILSQLLKGFAEGVRGLDGINTQSFTHACHQAVASAYSAVNPPVEGTILTVAREAAEAVSAYTTTHDDLAQAFGVLVSAAQAAMEKTPDLMPLLRQAGVVDSGGLGLMLILEGMQRLLNGNPVHINGASGSEGVLQQPQWQTALLPQDVEGYGYDVQFLMRGDALDVDAIRADINAMGWSALVVGDAALVKVHVHVHDPGVPLSYAIHSGAALDDVVVENMQLQYQAYVEHRLAHERGEDRQVPGAAVIAVVNGEGLTRLFYEGLGAARVITGGQTMNPSAEDFLAAIDSLHNDHIILLPNNNNVLLAAQQAAALARGRDVHVLPSRSIPQGISAMLATFDLRETGTIPAILDTMQEAIHDIKTGEITVATRDVTMNDLQIAQGEFIGLLNDHLVSAGTDLLLVVRDLLTKARADEHELITLYYGEGVTEKQANSLAASLRDMFAGLHVEVIAGGQPLYPYILSVE